MMKVLMIGVARLDKGGIESYLMSLFRNMNPDEFKIDFLVHSQDVGCLEEEIISCGSKIYKLPRLRKHPFKYCSELYRIIKNEKYDIVHRHATASVMWLDLAMAKKAGAKIRIAHSHNSAWGGQWYKAIHMIFRPFLNHYATSRLACSNKAGKWMFGKHKFDVAKNGIDENRFRFSREVRNNYRDELNLKNKKVVLMVARIVPEKNHLWFLNVIKKVVEKDSNVVFLFAGDGILHQEIKDEIDNLGLVNNVIMLGSRSDIPELMCASDLLVLPSLYEGLGIVLIEGQCSGLSCLASGNGTEDADIGLLKNLNLDIDTWTDAVLKTDSYQNDREKAYGLVTENNYSQVRTAKIMEDYYRNAYSLYHDVN